MSSPAARDRVRCLIAGDPGAAKLHLAVGGPGDAWPTTLLLKATGGGDWADDAWELAELAVETLDQAAAEVGKPHVVLLLESPAFAQGHRSHQLGAVHGSVLGLARSRGYRAGHAHVSKVKKFLTGRGNAGKPLVVSSLAARTGRTFRSDDEADVFGIWCYGMELAGQRHPLAGKLPAAHLEALDGQALPSTERKFP